MSAALARAEALTPEQAGLLGEVFADALAYRFDPETSCAGCEADARLCPDHASDYARAMAYETLAGDCGIAVPS